jgi:hypothetical protein
MGILDKAKDAAKTVGEKAKDGVAAGQEKVDEVKTKRRINDLKEELGGIVYLQQTGNPPTDADAQITRIVDDIKGAESQLQG